MNYTTSQNLNFTHESDQSSFRKTNGKVKNFGKINHIDFKPSINEKDFFSESNCGLSRSESPNELKKNNVYKKAEVFKNVTLADPKFKRMTESLTKVFGLSDPPPGFGFCYPRYYYLEQKRPQPMNPLKVWRGFNGNIYFEPMVLNNMSKSILIDNKCQTLKVKIEIEKNTFLKDKKKAENDKVDKAVNLRQNYDFVRMMSNIETSVKEKTPSTVCQKIVRNENDSCSMKKKKMEYQTIKLFDSKSFEIKRKKSPIKGLAFKESKRGLENFKENLIEEESVFSIKNDLKDEDISQSKQDFRNISADKNIRPNYKEMLKGIKKGKILKSDEFLAGTQKATGFLFNNKKKIIRFDSKL